MNLKKNKKLTHLRTKITLSLSKDSNKEVYMQKTIRERGEKDPEDSTDTTIRTSTSCRDTQRYVKRNKKEKREV